MKALLSITFFLLSMAASAQERDTTDVYLDKFEAFVVSIERNDSTVDWTQSNSEYKAMRMEFRNAHRGSVSDSQYARYNNLKARYLKQVSLKKVRNGFKRKASSISSAVKGTVEGVIGK